MTTSVSTNATLNYSFGQISITIKADGDNIDRPTEMCDQMLSTATTIAGIEIIKSRVSRESQEDSSDSTHEQYVMPITFGNGITVWVEVHFDLAGRISKRTLNSIVFGGILPKTIQTAGIYFGDHLNRAVYDDSDQILALFMDEFEMAGTSSQPDNRQSDQDNSR